MKKKMMKKKKMMMMMTNKSNQVNGVLVGETDRFI